MTSEGLPSAGEVLVAKYRLTRELGRGGMGAVYEAEHLRLGQKVAIKVVLPEVAQRPELAYRFEHEARAAARLRGRHTVRVLDTDATPEGLRYLVMELLEGHSLRDELDRRGQLPIAEAVRYVREACEGVSEVHRAGIVHRDLKPANLFLSVEEGGPVVKVVDFGIAKACGDADAKYETATNVPLGTCKYMSPEQVRSARSVDLRTDVWALGVVLYELLAGKAPFLGDGVLGIMYAVVMLPPTPLRTARPDVPEALAAIIERALCKDVAGRYQTVRELSEELAPFEEARFSSTLRSPDQPGLSHRGPKSNDFSPKPLLASPPDSQAASNLDLALAPTLAPAHEIPRGAKLSTLGTEMTQRARRPAQASGKEALDESITSGSKSHVVPILPVAPGHQARSSWLVYGTLAAFVGGGLGLGLQTARSQVGSTSLAPSPSEMTSRAEAQAHTLRPSGAEAQAHALPPLGAEASGHVHLLETTERAQPTEVSRGTLPPVAAAASEPSRQALSLMAAENGPTRPSTATAAEDGRVRTRSTKAASESERGSVAKALASATSAPFLPSIRKSPEDALSHQDKPAAAAAPATATPAPPKPQAPKESPDIDRFDHL